MSIGQIIPLKRKKERGRKRKRKEKGRKIECVHLTTPRSLIVRFPLDNKAMITDNTNVTDI